MSEEKEKIEITYFDMINPSENKLIKFLKKIHNTNFDDHINWEQDIFEFFGKEVFIFYIIKRNITTPIDNELETWIKQEFFGFNGMKVLYLDMNDIFKTLNKIYESYKIDNNIIINYASYFFKLNIMIRHSSIKKIDAEDSSFTKFYSKMIPITKEFYDLKNNSMKFYQHVYFLLSDGNIEFDDKKYLNEIEFKFNTKLSLQTKQNRNKKRTPIDSKLRHECFKRDKYKCIECGNSNNTSILHADHILPVSQGGQDELENLQTLCENCNLAKLNKYWKGPLISIKNNDSS